MKNEPSPLSVLGLDRRGALVYAYLCANGDAKAAGIGAATRLGRGDVYRALDDLVERDCVVARATRPATYAAVDPDVVFRRALAESHARGNAIVEAVPILAAWWAKTSGARRFESESFRRLEGEREIDAVARRMVQSAKRLVLILDGRPKTGSGRSPVRVEAIRRGIAPQVELRFLGGSLRPEDARSGRSRRTTRGVSSWFLVVDEKEALYLDGVAPSTVSPETGPRATWTDSPTLVAMAVALHGSMWAKTHETRGRVGE